MILDVNSVTLTGLIRETNQDSVFSAFLQYAGVFIVADGMGGHFQGELASGIVATEMSKWWEQNQTQIENLPFYTVVDLLDKEVRHINSIIVERYQIMGRIGGSTFCALLVHHNAYAVFNIGDSRLYLYAKHKVRQLTMDDVWENLPQIRQMTDSPDISNNPKKGKLVKAMGIDREISASISSNAIEKKMVFFLCSDGVYKHMGEKQLQSFLKKIKKPKDVALVNEKIRKIVYENGASDNMSMITVLVREE